MPLLLGDCVCRYTLAVRAALGQCSLCLGDLLLNLLVQELFLLVERQQRRPQVNDGIPSCVFGWRRSLSGKVREPARHCSQDWRV